MSTAGAHHGPPARRAAGLYTVIAIKAGKGLLLLALGLGLVSLLGRDLGAQFERMVVFLRQDPESEFWIAVGRQVEAITPQNLRWLASGTLLYAALLFVESLGLWRRAWWAMWLAIGETAFFIPLEVFDLLREFRPAVLAVLVVNVAIVLYLARNRERLFRHH
jgi:uncharacterized membrane protein (DUF2068 family)